jgi:hypothetical protein
MNDVFFHKQAESLAARVQAAGTSDADRLRAAFRLLYGRSPEKDELRDMTKFLAEFRSFIPDKMTGSRYLDGSKREWVMLNFEYSSSFSAWKTWILARSALGIRPAERKS